MGGGKFALQAFLIIIISALACACTKKPKQSDERALHASVVYNADSLEHYMELAYLHEDPKAMYIIAGAAYLKCQGDPHFDTLYTVPLEEARTMLWGAAHVHHYQPAIDAIQCLIDHGAWYDDIPNDK